MITLKTKHISYFSFMLSFMKRNGHLILTWSCKGECPLHTEEYNISRAITGLSALLLIASSHKLCMLRPHLNNSSICVCFFLLMPIITITKNKKGDYNKMCVKDNSPLLYSNSCLKLEVPNWTKWVIDHLQTRSALCTY